MLNYIAIVEDGGESNATGVWFPDLPGCFSGGDSLDEALINAREGLAFHIEGLREEGLPVPPPRSAQQLRLDPEIAAEMDRYMVLLVPLDEMPAAIAAE
jgi:predicted RNase H-like HicB family nuclease